VNVYEENYLEKQINMAQIKSSTQNFTEIEDITADIVFLKNGYAACIVEVASVNFYLLSEEEQQVRIYGFMSLLNSLSFPIQILIVSKNVDVSTYLSLVDHQIAVEKRPKILDHIKHYKDFLQSLIKSKNLLDKKFYIVIPFSTLELGAVNATKSIHSNRQEYIKKVADGLSAKRTNIMTELSRMGLGARQLLTEDIIKLFYEMYNQDTISLNYDESDIKNIVL